MKAEVTAIIEAAPEGGFWAICPEFPGANGQGETIEETKENLTQAIGLIVQDRILWGSNYPVKRRRFPLCRSWLSLKKSSFAGRGA